MIALQPAWRVCVVVWLVVSLCFCVPAEARRPGANLVLVLIDPGSSVQGVSAETFIAALKLQLKPYRMVGQPLSWTKPPDTRQRMVSAQRLVQRWHAAAAVWYEASATGSGVVIVSVVQGADSNPVSSMPLPASRAIERSMALSARTLLILSPSAARPAGSRDRVGTPAVTRDATAEEGGDDHVGVLPRPDIESTDAPEPARSPPTVAAAAPEPNPTPDRPRNTALAADANVQVPRARRSRQPYSRASMPRSEWSLRSHAQYGLLGFPIGGDLRHGPEAGLQWRFWGPLMLTLAVAYRFTEAEQEKRIDWARRFFDSTLGLTHRWCIGTTQLAGGAQVRVGQVWIEAAEPLSDRRQKSHAVEISIGGVAEASVRLSRRASLTGTVVAAWIARGYELVLGDFQASNPGALELGLAAGFRVDLL